MDEQAISQPRLPRTVVYPSKGIIAEFRQRLAEGRWKPGERIPAEADLAVQFGVCRATINKILKELEREKLLWAGPGRGRFVSDRQTHRRTGVIEVVVAEAHMLAQPAFVRLADAISSAAAQAGYHFRVAQLNGFEFADVDQWLRVVDPDQIDGCIIITQAIQLEVAEALASRVPVVWFHHTTRGPRLAGVRYDWLGGAFTAARHLIELGHRHLGLVAADEKFVAASQQVAGVRVALQNLVANREGVLEVATARVYREEEGYRMTHELLARPVRPTAIVCASDDFAPGVFKALAEAGLRVPDDMSVISWNDTLRPEECPVPMTTMRMDCEGSGRAAAESLLRMIQNPEQAVATVESSMELVVRSSTVPYRQTGNHGTT